MSEQTVQDFYEQETQVYDETRFKSIHGQYENFVQQSTTLKLLGNLEGKSVLELGSGTGRFTRELAQRGAKVVCVDLSRKMHERARLVLKGSQVEHLVMSGSSLGFDSNTFDLCLTVNMLSHIKDASSIFVEVSRVLKKDGFFVANFPNLAGFYFPVGGFVNLTEHSLQAPVYSKWYSISGIFSALRSSGLDPVNVLGRVIFPKKHCPSFLFHCLKNLDDLLLRFGLDFLSGDLFVKARNLSGLMSAGKNSSHLNFKSIGEHR